MRPATALDSPISTDAVRRVRAELRELMRRAQAVLRTAEPTVDLGLRRSTLDVLGDVVTHPRTSPAEIAEHLHVDEAAALRHVIELEQLGLITRVTDLRHPAFKVLMPTSMGERIHRHGADAATEALQATLAGWTADEVETLTRLLAKLNQSQPA